MKPYPSIDEREKRTRRPIAIYPDIEDSQKTHRKRTIKESLKLQPDSDNVNTMYGNRELTVDDRKVKKKKTSEEPRKLQPESDSQNAVHGNRDHTKDVRKTNMNTTSEEHLKSKPESAKPNILHSSDNHDIDNRSVIVGKRKKLTINLRSIYFSMPSSDGSFQISHGATSNDGKKYFRIEFEESSTEGMLFYITGDRDQRAINRLESYLKPVCIIKNITNAGTASKIKLIQSGKVSRVNDRWIIDVNNKTKIELY